jgi:UDP-glucose 4-epimerase
LPPRNGRPIPLKVVEARAGDAPALVADSRLAREVLGWVPRYTTIEPIVETAWRWHQSHPDGYGD